MASRTNTTTPLTREELRLYDRLIAREAPAVLMVSGERLTSQALARIVSDFAKAQIAERRLVAKGTSR